MNDQLASRIEQATPKVEALRPAEPVKPPEKPGLAEQNIIKRIDQDGDPNKVLKDIADGVQPTSGGREKTPFDQFVEDASETEKTPIVGGEIVTPGARKVGEQDNSQAVQRGWLAALTSANGKGDLSPEQRQQNIQQIVDAAKAVGIPKDALRAHLQSLGIGVSNLEQGSAKTSVEDQTPLSENRIQAYLTEISLQVPKVAEGSLTVQQFQAMIDSAKAAGVPPEMLRDHLQGLGIGVVKAPENVNMAQVKIENRGGILQEPDYDQLARQVPIDIQNPPSPDNLIAPVMGNVFNEIDNPTLAGKATMNLYDGLVLRRDSGINFTGRGQEYVNKGREAGRDYSVYLQEINRQRITEGLKPFTIATEHQSGTDCFHMDGKNNNVGDPHIFYFNKSHANWKNPDEQLVRGYITLKPSEVAQVQRHFVDLSVQLYDAGIDFTAKAASPYGADKRTDNMVFYISLQDQARASGIIKQFLTERGLGKGHVEAAVHSPQEGLSWAMELTPEQKKIWQETSGSTRDGSYNVFVATMMMPTYLERLAQVHENKGDISVATVYRQEAERVKAVIAKYKAN